MTTEKGNFKKCKVVILPTDNKTASIGLDLRGKLYTSTINLIPQHLHILSDEEIKEGDWFFAGKEICHASKNYSFINNDKKIIATTDSSLKYFVQYNKNTGEGFMQELPQPSPQFIESYVKAYNEGKQIEEVIVEYEQKVVKQPKTGQHTNSVQWENVIKVDKNNQITIKKLKDSWSREELKEVLVNIVTDFITQRYTSVPKWIQENL